MNFVDPTGNFGMEDLEAIAADLPTIPQSAVDSSAGFGDGLLFGFGQNLRDELGIGGVNQCSNAYKAGSWVSLAVGGVRLGYAGLAKAGSILAKSGLQASAFRQTFKNVFRAGVGKSWRPFTNPKNLTDELLRKSAGKTNKYINAYGAGVIASGYNGASE